MGIGTWVGGQIGASKSTVIYEHVSRSYGIGAGIQLDETGPDSPPLRFFEPSPLSRNLW